MVVIAAGLVGTGNLLAGAAVLVAGSLLDAVDGALARATGGTTAFGSFLDSTLDRAAEAILYGGVIAYYLARSRPDRAGPPGARRPVRDRSWSATRVREAEGIGISAAVGLAPRTERLVLVVAGIVLAGLGLRDRPHRRHRHRRRPVGGDHHPAHLARSTRLTSSPQSAAPTARGEIATVANKQRQERRRTGTRPSDGKIRVAIVGVGNCASSLVQGRYYYENAKQGDLVPGLMHVNLGGYHIRDIEFVAAFDVDKTKVGKDLSEAVFAGPEQHLQVQPTCRTPASPSTAA